MLDAVEDFGVPVDTQLLLDIHPAWRVKGLLPQAGGVLDQDPAVMQALYLLDYMIAWTIQNEQREDNLPDFDQLFKD